MTLKNITAVAIAGALAFGLVVPTLAQDALTGLDAIAKRQELMKSNGGTMRSAGSATGDDAIAAAQTIVDNFAEIGALWPEDSKTGGDTTASPAIWTDNAGFLVAYNAAVDASAAMLAAAQAGDMAAYGNSLKAVGGSCGGCHSGYRIKK